MNNDVIISNRNSKRRSGIIKPINNTQPPDDASCKICNTGKLNAVGLCVLCNIVICENHSIIIDNKKYCINCRNSNTYKPLISAISEYDIKVKSRISNLNCCIIS